MRPPLVLLLCLSAATASAQQTWGSVHFGQSRDSVQAQLNNQNLPVESAPDGALQTNSDYPLPLPGLPYPIPMMANFHFDINTKLDTVVLSLDVAAMRHDWSSLGSDEALYTFAANKLSFALAGQYGAPIFSSSTCNVATEDLTTPCTIQWHGTNQVIQLESIPTGRHLRIRYLPLAGAL